MLITLLHVSCEMPKGSKGAAKGGRQPPVETVGMLAPPILPHPLKGCSR